MEQRSGWYTKAMALLDAYRNQNWAECEKLCTECLECICFCLAFVYIYCLYQAMCFT